MYKRLTLHHAHKCRKGNRRAFRLKVATRGTIERFFEELFESTKRDAMGDLADLKDEWVAIVIVIKVCASNSKVKQLVTVIRDLLTSLWRITSCLADSG